MLADTIIHQYRVRDWETLDTLGKVWESPENTGKVSKVPFEVRKQFDSKQKEFLNLGFGYVYSVFLLSLNIQSAKC